MSVKMFNDVESNQRPWTIAGQAALKEKSFV